MAPLALVDATFFSANLTKLLSGGYVPLLLASAVYGTMTVWHVGMDAIVDRLKETLEPMDDFFARLARDHIARVPGTGVFLTRAKAHTPPVLAWYVGKARALQERVFILRLETLPIPWSRYSDRMTIEHLAPGFWRGTARFGFMERPDVPALLRDAKLEGCDINLDDVTYFIGHETVIARGGGMGLPRFVEVFFAFMQRNAAHATDYFHVPHDSVVEIGREIAI
jgi:KUP system potassium uptake protein